MTIKEQPEEQVVRVVAPSNLNAGYTFNVSTEDGRSLTVKVPEGGVVEGQSFDAEVVVVNTSLTSSATNPEYVVPPPTAPEVNLSEAVPVAVGAPIITKTVTNNPDGTQTICEETRYPDGRVTTTTTTTTTTKVTAADAAEAQPAFAVPTGAWRNDLFSCFDTCSSGVFWMSWCFSLIALGQLLQRLKLNAIGSESADSYKYSCVIWTIVTFVGWLIGLLLLNVTQGVSIAVIYFVAGIIALVAMTQTRYYMRQKYSIPADCCADSGCLSDCCCMYWCSCCGIIQMMRHTHDERKYVYNCTSQTGLYSDVPEIV